MRMLTDVLDDLRREVASLEQVRVAYHELLFAVSKEYPDETRHQTALRYIQQQERGCACTTGLASARSVEDQP